MGKTSKLHNAAHYNFMDVLEKYVEDILKTKNRVLISVVGKNGTGKSHFGRYVRKNGLGHFNKKNVSIIDDRIIVKEFLYFFKKRVKIPHNSVDGIQPFLSDLPDRKKVILYINNSPGEKIKEADILLKLTTDEQTRRGRLKKRYGHDPEKLKRYLDKGDTEDYGIKYRYLLEAKI